MSAGRLYFITGNKDMLALYGSPIFAGRMSPTELGQYVLAHYGPEIKTVEDFTKLVDSFNEDHFHYTQELVTLQGLGAIGLKPSEEYFYYAFDVQRKVLICPGDLECYAYIRNAASVPVTIEGVYEAVELRPEQGVVMYGREFVPVNGVEMDETIMEMDKLQQKKIWWDELTAHSHLEGFSKEDCEVLRKEFTTLGSIAYIYKNDQEYVEDELPVLKNIPEWVRESYIDWKGIAENLSSKVMDIRLPSGKWVSV